MMRSSRLNLINKSIFTIDDARAVGISPRMLSYFTKKNMLRRISHGVYTKESELNFDIQFILKRILIEVPQGFIGRLSALKFYGLLDEDPGQVEVIVPNNNVPKRKIEDTRFFLAPPHTLKKGIAKKNGIRVSILERTLIESLKTGVSQKTIRTAFEEAQRKGLKPSLSLMDKFAKLLRVQVKFKQFREAIL